MTQDSSNRGGAPVGFLEELDSVEAASVIYLRLWCSGPDARAEVENDLAYGLGTDHADHVLRSFDQLCTMCARHGRRPLMRHSVHCKCLGADESCFANFIATAANGDMEDAMMFATLLVRPDMAPMITSLATDFGLGLKKMRLSNPRSFETQRPAHVPLH